jgi:hypothetical protein
VFAVAEPVFSSRRSSTRGSASSSSVIVISAAWLPVTVAPVSPDRFT